MILQMKTMKIIIKNGHIFQIIYIDGHSESRKTNASLNLIIKQIVMKLLRRIICMLKT